MSRIATTVDVLMAIIIAGLAAARVHQFFAADSLTMRFRAWLTNWPVVYEWATCPWCSGFWYAVALFWLVVEVKDAGLWVGMVAAAQIAGLGAMLAHRETDS